MQNLNANAFSAKPAYFGVQDFAFARA